MSIEFGDNTPERLAAIKQRRERLYGGAASRRAEQREKTLEKRLEEFFAPYQEVKKKFDGLQQNYGKAVSIEKTLEMADALVEVAEKGGTATATTEEEELGFIAEAMNKKNVYRFMRHRRGLETLLRNSQNKLQETIQQIQGDPKFSATTTFWNKLDEWGKFNL